MPILPRRLTPTPASAAIIDPELEPGRPLRRARRDAKGLRIRYIDRHAHARRSLLGGARARATARRAGRHAPASPAPFVDMRVDDGELLVVGELRLQVLHTPGHTRDSMCLDRRGSGASPATRCSSAAPGAPICRPATRRRCYESLFEHAARLDPRAQGLPGARLQGPQPLDDRRRRCAANPRLQKTRARRLRRADAQPQPHDADASHRGAAHEPRGRQDRRAAARRGGARRCRSWASRS